MKPKNDTYQFFRMFFFDTWHFSMILIISLFGNKLNSNQILKINNHILITLLCLFCLKN